MTQSDQPESQTASQRAISHAIAACVILFIVVTSVISKESSLLVFERWPTWLLFGLDPPLASFVVLYYSQMRPELTKARRALLCLLISYLIFVCIVVVCCVALGVAALLSRGAARY